MRARCTTEMRSLNEGNLLDALLQKKSLCSMSTMSDISDCEVANGGLSAPSVGSCFHAAEVWKGIAYDSMYPCFLDKLTPRNALSLHSLKTSNSKSLESCRRFLKGHSKVLASCYAAAPLNMTAPEFLTAATTFSTGDCKCHQYATTG